ncbi:helix-turn-helix domain-containing protein [Ideonella sp. 4Y16]|uniref:helix-turn-helix domain-containing protein n=1 Tax=Ideonella alba TaxID=2824118 RepID=UPI001B38B521|nr:helix-turn-helix domain-containing protein [Ideonella alba]MBQ0944526.1 helix-turn-helix domain-containing protein [Ideonella alba]
MSALPRPPGDASPAWHHLLETSDLDELAEGQPDWQLRYQQLSAGSFRGAVQHLQLPGLRLVREQVSQAVHQKGHLGQGNYGFAMMPALQGEAIFNGQRLDAQAIMVGRSDDLDLLSPAGSTLIGVVVSEELLNPLWERMYQKPLARWLDSQIVLRTRPAAAQAVQQLHLATMAHLAERGTDALDDTTLKQARDAVLIEWIEALPAAVDTTELKTVGARRRVVDRACELMLGNTAEPLSVLELCRQVGASRRKLNYCFQDVLGTSPLKYLRLVRLNGARRELKTGRDRGLTVQDVASRWGFWHLGQFALDYKKQFGELPSVTLRG